MPGLYDCIYPDSRLNSSHAGMRGNYYELPDGTHVDLFSRPCWCINCNTVTDGEWIESVDELEQKSRELIDPKTEIYKFHEQSEVIFYQIHCLSTERIGFRENAIQKNIARLKWRRLRTALPKCIVCGSTSVHYPDENNDGLVAIDDTIVVWIRNRGMCSTLSNEWFFTVNGDRIRRDAKPNNGTYPKSTT